MSNYAKPTPLTLTTLHGKAWELIAEAEEAGVVISIESVPGRPLAMGNHWMNAKVRPARACQPRPPETTTAEELVWLANYRMKRFIAERHQFELDQVNAEFDWVAVEADNRTRNAEIEAMRRQGRSWIVKPFVRYRT